MTISFLPGDMVRKGGFEPPRLSAPPPQDGVSASSTTSACTTSACTTAACTTCACATCALDQFRVSTIIAKLVFDNGGEGTCIEAGAAHQGAVDFFFGHQGLRIFWFHRSTIKDAEGFGHFVAKGFGGFSANQDVGFGGELGGGGFAGSDGPDGFVGDHQLSRFLAGDGMKSAQTLTAKDIFGESGFAFFQDFAHTDDWS